MKFKMAPNSLFAQLLRSPWWISFAIALAFVLAARALLPVPYQLPFSLGAIPFLVIGAIAAWRQFRAPSANERQAILDVVQSLPWPAFRDLLQQGYERQGFRVERMEGAADLVLFQGGATTLVAAKRWKAATHGEAAIAALISLAQERGATRCVYVALGELSANARRRAQAAGVELLANSGLVALLHGLPLGR